MKDLFRSLGFGLGLVLTIYSFSIAETLEVQGCDTIWFDSADMLQGRQYYELSIAAYDNGDLALVGGIFGIYGRLPADTAWRRIVCCRPRGDTWWNDYEIAKQKHTLFYPSMFQAPDGSDSVYLFDDWILGFYSLQVNTEGATVHFLSDYDEIVGRDFVRNFCPYHDIFVCGALTYDDPGVTIARLSLSPPDYETIYRFPDDLSRRLAAVGVVSPEPRVGIIPGDSTAWVAFAGNRYVYVIDLRGSLIDSVQITTPDYLEPQLPRSRMKSTAVRTAWNAAFTPLERICGVSPGYMLLQYRTGWEKLATDSLPTFSTVTWNRDRQPVELTIDKRQQVAGSDSKGRLILAEYLVDKGGVGGLRIDRAKVMPQSNENGAPIR